MIDKAYAELAAQSPGPTISKEACVACRCVAFPTVGQHVVRALRADGSVHSALSAHCPPSHPRAAPRLRCGAFAASCAGSHFRV